MNKYHAKRTEYNGVQYDSQGEAFLASQINLMLLAGLLTRVARQVSYDLRGYNGGLICRHVVDFVLEFADGHTELWEYKGVPTPDYKIKKKLFEDNYPNLTYIIHSKNRSFNAKTYSERNSAKRHLVQAAHGGKGRTGQRAE